MNAEIYLELLPLLIVGFLVGIISFFNDERGVKNHAELKHLIYNALKITFTSSIICAITYAILSSTDLDYMAKVGISSAISFLGIEKTLNLAKELLNFKRRL